MGAAGDKNTALAFKVEWFDPTSEVARTFLLTFYPSDKSVEMFDLKQRKTFLARIRADSPDLDPKDFALNNEVVIFSRRLRVLEYADEATKRALEAGDEYTLAMVKPDGMEFLAGIASDVESAGFVVCRAKMVRMSRQHAQEFYKEHSERNFYPDLVDYMSSGPVLAMELRRANAVKEWRALLGPTDSNRARAEAPDSIRAKFGADKTNNAAHGSDSVRSAKREIDFFFPESNPAKSLAPKAVFRMNKSTCCVIKPHAVKSGQIGAILTSVISAGFSVTGFRSFKLNFEHAEEFFEIYKGVVHDYTGMVKQLSSGTCLVAEISHPRFDDVEVVTKFRELVGPPDPQLARTLRPNSIRAKFGLTVDENAVHCTDLPEDAVLEIEYFFKLLN